MSSLWSVHINHLTSPDLISGDLISSEPSVPRLVTATANWIASDERIYNCLCVLVCNTVHVVASLPWLQPITAHSVRMKWDQFRWCETRWDEIVTRNSPRTRPVSAPSTRATLCYTVKNIRISTDILWQVFHILTEPVSYTFVSINRRNNEAHCGYTDIVYSVSTQNAVICSQCDSTGRVLIYHHFDSIFSSRCSLVDCSLISSSDSYTCDCR